MRFTYHCGQQPLPGYAIKLFINDNTPVKEGDDLVEIDRRPYEAELAQAQANLDVAIAQANSAQLQIGLTRSTTTHATSGASGPTTTRSIPRSRQKAAIAPWSVKSSGTHSACCEIPALPGAQ